MVTCPAVDAPDAKTHEADEDKASDPSENTDFVVSLCRKCLVIMHENHEELQGLEDNAYKQ